MHGRLKVKTSAEKQAEKEKEREKKKLVYQGCMKKIRQLYLSGDRSPELLKLTSGIIENIPEFGTLWNWRRTVLLDMFQKDTDTESEPTKGELILAEKRLVVRCLEVNPKAYALWMHRRWLVEQDPTVEALTEELELCNLFLKYDERNFHCWDYRRFIVKLGGTSRTSELDKSTSLIERNFSNYSAWHYRSTLLDIQDKEVVDRELEWTQNAYFTDPADQSVWLYYQWLLGRRKKSESLLAVKQDKDNSQVIVLISTTSYSPPIIQVEPSVELTWKSNAVPSQVWYADCGTTVSSLTYGESSITLDKDLVASSSSLSPCVEFTAPLSIAHDQLANIRELYEIEPDNKWVILTLVNMLNTLHKHKTREQISELRNLTVKLCQVDPMRTGYYRDMWSKLLCETAVNDWWTGGEPSLPMYLSKKYLTSLFYTDYLFALQDLDISHNNLTNLIGFGSLVLLRKLNLSHNKLSSLQGLEACKNLAVLDASHNALHNACGILACTKCRINTLSLEGNPLSRSEVYPACVLESFVMLCTLDGKDL